MTGAVRLGVSWETRSTPSLDDFVVVLGAPETLLGIRPQGTLLSTGGGREWKPPDTPRFMTLAADRNRVWTVAAQGSVYVSEDVGRRWRRPRNPGGAPRGTSGEIPTCSSPLGQAWA